MQTLIEQLDIKQIQVNDIELGSNKEYIECIKYIVKWFTDKISSSNNKHFHAQPIDISNIEVNPYKNKLIDGIAMEMYYGFPHALWTKYGTVRIIGSYHFYDGIGSEIRNSIVEEMLDIFGCDVFIKKEINWIGEFGPVYQLKHVNGVYPGRVTKSIDTYYEYNKEEVDNVRKIISM